MLDLVVGVVRERFAGTGARHDPGQRCLVVDTESHHRGLAQRGAPRHETAETVTEDDDGKPTCLVGDDGEEVINVVGEVDRDEVS